MWWCFLFHVAHCQRVQRWPGALGWIRVVAMYPPGGQTISMIAIKSVVVAIRGERHNIARYREGSNLDCRSCLHAVLPGPFEWAGWSREH
jgi:hypothetical protein